MYDFDVANSSFRLSGVPYLEFLSALHSNLAPRTYLEIGTNAGDSLATVRCDAIAVDPKFLLQTGATGNRARTFLFQMPSDAFFANENAAGLLGRPVDIVFLDGMHLFEFLLRDLIGAEAACHSRSLILLHDCLPLNPRMALRRYYHGDPAIEPDTMYDWTGDVWKLLPILREYRPELRMHVLNCPPTGLVAITNLDPTSRTLADGYYDIVDQYAECDFDEHHLRSFWKQLKLTDSTPLCADPGRLSTLFSLY